MLLMSSLKISFINIDVSHILLINLNNFVKNFFSLPQVFFSPIYHNLYIVCSWSIHIRLSEHWVQCSMSLIGVFVNVPFMMKY